MNNFIPVLLLFQVFVYEYVVKELFRFSKLVHYLNFLLHIELAAVWILQQIKSWIVEIYILEFLYQILRNQCCVHELQAPRYNILIYEIFASRRQVS